MGDETIALEAALPLPRLIPYGAGGDLAYGGRLHGLLAGGLYAGTLPAQDLCLARCGETRLLARCRRGVLVELYYVEPSSLSLLDKRLSSLGASRKTIVLGSGEALVRAEAHLVEGCEPLVEEQEKWIRILLVLPPQAPPPATPMAVYTVSLPMLSPCSDQQAFCKTGSGSEAAVADLVVASNVLEDWLRSIRAGLYTTPARLLHSGLTVYAHVPLRLGETGA